ncbi:ATP-binding cassette domain-containing protein [Hoeflea sp. TYP-13]|uniref:ATP-binding cassette domain-containing protein n=1 Tax=Hoeflea sp. TYP-13 TaxID=3230023 RepID=UPI0034C6BC29
MNTSTDYVVETCNLSKSYGAVQAVQDVNFKLSSNEVVGLLGDNGAGKTTLIRMISGAEKPTGGQIMLRGEPVEMQSPRDAMRAGIETIHQYNSTVGTMSVAENIFLGREMLAGRIGNFGILRRSEMRRLAEASLGNVGFHLRSPDAQVGELSGGQRQGVAIARALQFQSKIMILDEPTNHISVKETNNVIDFTKNLPNRGYSGIFISHNLGHVFDCCSRIVVMSRGRIVADEKSEALTISKIESLL